MNQTKNTLEWYHLEKESLLEKKDWKGRQDIVNIVMIGLSKNLPERNEKYKLHRLLGILFSQQLNAEEKIELLENEYEIVTGKKFREDVKEMCNLSQGIKEAGKLEGIKLGKEEERKNTEKERMRADELEKKNIWLMEQLAEHGIIV